MNEDQRLKQAFLDMLDQSCAEYRAKYEGLNLIGTEFLGYNSQCIDAYQKAIELALEFGWIEDKEVLF